MCPAKYIRNESHGDVSLLTCLGPVWIPRALVLGRGVMDHFYIICAVGIAICNFQKKSYSVSERNLRLSSADDGCGHSGETCRKLIAFIMVHARLLPHYE
jgi:hypothetical protein